jgi:PIN domain nuclease of toxin-antitoxin system
MLQDPSHVLLLSAGSVWEVAIKTGLGKLILSYPFRQWMMRAIADLEIEILPVTIEYADLQATLPDHHRDPFDRLIAAQSIIENAPLVSNDVIFDRYGLVRLWN